MNPIDLVLRVNRGILLLQICWTGFVILCQNLRGQCYHICYTAECGWSSSGQRPYADIN